MRAMDTAFVSMSAARVSRRSAIQLAALSLAGVCAAKASRPAYALKPGKPSKEKLLAGIREEKTPEEIEEEKARVAEEKRLRLERQRELQSVAERKKLGLEPAAEEAEIESNLRGQYYYPTARKRYLPRVKKAWEALDEAERLASDGQWKELADISTTDVADALLPMRLYASSLAGGGLSISAKFIERMNLQADAYEQCLKKLSKAVKRKETAVAVGSIRDMREAIGKYREIGRLQADDFGIGEIPLESRVGSGFGNNNSALYRRNKNVEKALDMNR